jgi:flagellar biosynthesis/type III secretory pathway protein FliH
MGETTVSGLLKAGDRTAQSAVRRLSAMPLSARDLVSDLPSPEPKRNAGSFDTIEEKASARTEELDRQCMALEATIADLRHQLRQAEENATRQSQAALERGRGEGKELAETSETVRIDALTASLARMEREQTEWLSDCEVLALQLTRAALARVLGGGENYAELISATLDRQFAQLKRELALGVRVSPIDFADAASLAELSAMHPGIPVRHDDDLASGECVIDLKLGQLDLGIPGQWQRLTSFFDELANEERPE